MFRNEFKDFSLECLKDFYEENECRKCEPLSRPWKFREAVRKEIERREKYEKILNKFKGIIDRGLAAI